MLDGINDQPEKAKELAGLIKSLHCHVNLIPYNPIGLELRAESCELSLKRPPSGKIYSFKDILEKRSGKKVTVRRERGVDIAAACGQLANLFTNR